MGISKATKRYQKQHSKGSDAPAAKGKGSGKSKGGVVKKAVKGTPTRGHGGSKPSKKSGGSKPKRGGIFLGLQSLLLTPDATAPTLHTALYFRSL